MNGSDKELRIKIKNLIISRSKQIWNLRIIITVYETTFFPFVYLFILNLSFPLFSVLIKSVIKNIDI